MRPVDYDEAMGVLIAWEGREVLVVAYVEPGVSLNPFMGRLACEDDGHGVVRGTVTPRSGTPVRIAFPSGTFHEADWSPGLGERGLTVVQGATRVDVFLED
ncbi:MAG: hypothetical protein JWM71_2458 [Solirubrobacteraceae bacterium]|nr:hypothetical protein [Solirubrobacteraceae bacterium]